MRSGIQLPYLARWIDMESGGNACAVGAPGAEGADGLPREVGIVQLYNPDDLARTGTTGAQLRAYCVSTRAPVTYRGRTVMAFSQELSRPLTKEEIDQQANLAVDLVRRSMMSASNDLRGVGAGAGWSTKTRDFWALVKLQHGLPGISRSGLPAVAKELGRPPRDWAEFVAALAKVKLDDGTERYRSEFPRILKNAETCAEAFTPPGVT